MKQGKPDEKQNRADVDLKKGTNLAANMWAVQMFFLTFVLSMSFSVMSEILLVSSNVALAFTLLAVLILINIIFDTVAVAATSCTSESFRFAKYKKDKSLKLAVKLVRNAEKVNNICGDVIGDICGIVSGALGASIVLKIFAVGGATPDSVIISLLFSSITAALTVGGKAIGKKIAITSNTEIIYFVAKCLSLFKK